MYHICPARCQTQFIRGEGADRRNWASAAGGAGLAVELAATVLGGFPGMDKGQYAPPGDGLLDLGIAELRLAGLVGKGQG